ncbi:DeoR/GlpR transcriptional regulator [Photobacterium sanctipauli]|uniref:DeoR/GlpR transcriptional regulator n=1 Tax=Photobacterium sanctipauli TaxID=1342794 RepID=A0A2T3NWY0_9GAMM|nr:DeoR/GlpR family DNA-binding transcription regulator [Photobacterium sanctipauli]PSW20803.1 DeoR/GlpR transcriptional regulator [Photobacterium sanctipauli]
MVLSSRANEILDMVNKFGQVSASDLAQSLTVSVETIRRDLKKLDERGELTRVHGGAVSKQYQDAGTSFNRRANSNVEAKQALVNKALSYFYEGAVIGLDASTSSWLVAQAMPDRKCTVVTHSQNNIAVLADKNNINVICLGGHYSKKHNAFYGQLTKQALSTMSLDFSVISCSGYGPGIGVWDSNEYNCEVKQALIASADTCILIADKTKLNKKSLIKVCDMESISVVVTN